MRKNSCRRRHLRKENKKKKFFRGNKTSRATTNSDTFQCDLRSLFRAKHLFDFLNHPLTVGRKTFIESNDASRALFNRVQPCSPHFSPFE